MQHLELRSGATLRLLAVQQMLVLVAAGTLSAASTPWKWLVVALLALLVTNLAASIYQRRAQPAGRLVLRADGSLRLQQGGFEHAGRLQPGAWVSRWLCVLRWKPLRARTTRACLVCSWANGFDDYRRLLVRLRLGPESRRPW